MLLCSGCFWTSAIEVSVRSPKPVGCELIKLSCVAFPLFSSALHGSVYKKLQICVLDMGFPNLQTGYWYEFQSKQNEGDIHVWLKGVSTSVSQFQKHKANLQQFQNLIAYLKKRAKITHLLFRSVIYYQSLWERTCSVFQVARKFSFWMQTSQSAFQNESLHLLVLTMVIKAGITLQQSSSYIKAEHCLQREKEGRSSETLCSPGYFLENNFFSFFVGKKS